MKLCIYDDYLSEIIDYDKEKDVYNLRSFIGVRATYPIRALEMDNLLKDDDIIGQYCHIDHSISRWYIRGREGNTLILTHDVESDNLRRFVLSEPKTTPEYKDTNPKDAIGIAKCPMSTLSGPVLMEMGLGMAEGGLKYGTHNYREMGVSFRVYFDATMRHLWAAFEGEDVDPASGLSHITKAMTSLHVLRDAQIRGKWNDDRPRGTKGFIDFYNKKMEELIEKYPNPKSPYTANGNPPDEFRFV